MVCLVDPDGIVSRSQKKILETQSNFYKQLYTSDAKIEFTFVNDSNIKLTEDEKVEMDKPITLEELTKALRKIKLNCTPGCDGLSTNLYLAVWDELGLLLLNALNHAFEIACLHLSTRRGIINLIPKKDRDPIFVKN